MFRMLAWRTAETRPAHRRHALPAALLAAITIAAGVVVAGAPAGAADRPVRARAHFAYAWQSRVTHDIHVQGVARDRHHPHRRITVGFFVNGKLAKTVRANNRTPGAKWVGRHGFATVLHRRHIVHRV